MKHISNSSIPLKSKFLNNVYINRYWLFVFLITTCVSFSPVIAQTDGVLIDYVGNTRDNSAVLDVRSTTQGALVPRMTLVDRDAISNPAKSLLIFQTDNSPGYYYNSGTPATPVWTRLIESIGSNNVTGSGAATRIAYWNGTNTISSNANLYWDNSNNRVGIGTTTPLFGAHIASNTTMDADISEGTAQLSVGGASSVSKRMLLGYDTNGNGFGFIKAGNYGVTWTPLALQPNGGNVGIGNTNPSYKLDVSGTGRFTGNVTTGDVINLGNLSSVATSAYRGITWESSFNDPNYAIFKPAGAWTQPLHVAFYTGIKIGARYDYGGTKFYNDPNMSTELMSVGNGDNHTRVNYNLYAPIMYDINDAGYYVDPNGTSEMNVFTRNTLARSSLNGLQNNSPVTTRSVQGDNYKTGAMGWGSNNMNVIYSNWGSGFIDSWSNPANAPGGSSHYVGFQGMHHSYQNGSQAHGFQMVTAGEAENRFFWRNGWPNLRPWVEMIHTGNLSGLGIQNQNSSAQSANWWISGTGRADNGLLTGSSGGYNTFYSWTNLPGHHGLYSSVHNGAHFYPNNGSYGAWRIDGNRNGWLGIEFGGGAQATSLMMGTTGQGWGNQTTGIHNNGYGWLWRFEHDDLYADRMIDVNDNGYYVDPTGTTVLAYDNYLSHIGGVARVGHGWSWNYCVGGYYCCSWDWWGSCNGNCYDGCQSTQAHLKLSVYGAAESLGWWGWSDGRFKKNISALPSALALVKQMKGVTYDWKDLGKTYDETIINGQKESYNGSDESSAAGGFRSDVGVIAQDLKDVLPMAVMEVEDKDSAGTVIGMHFSVNYDKIIPVLIEAIKEQQKQIEELQAMSGLGGLNQSNQKTNDALIKAMNERASTMGPEVQDMIELMAEKIKSGVHVPENVMQQINEFITNGTIPPTK